MNSISEITRIESHTYFSEIGSFRGAVLIKNKWVSIKNLNYIKKTGWNRWQGPPNKKMQDAMRQTPICAKILFPSLVIYKSD